MADESILSKLKRMDDAFATAEVNLRAARMELDNIAHMMGFSRTHRESLPAMEDEEKVPYPALSETELTRTNGVVIK